MASTPDEAQLQAAIQLKVMDIGWTDNDASLAEYITHMLGPGTDWQQLKFDVGANRNLDEDDPVLVNFIQWLFDYVGSLFAPQQQQEVSQLQPPLSQSRTTGYPSATKDPGWQTRNWMQNESTREPAGPPEVIEQPAQQPGNVRPGALWTSLFDRPSNQANDPATRIITPTTVPPINTVTGTSRYNGQNPATEPTTPPPRPNRRAHALPFCRPGDSYPQVRPSVDWNHRPTYVMPTHTRDTFNIGDVISRPFHTPNLNANARRDQITICETKLYNHMKIATRLCCCHVYTKQRMFVIIFKHATTMFCLPLYSYAGKGFKGISKDQWHEHVGLRATMLRDQFIVYGERKPIGFEHMTDELQFALDVSTTISLVSGTTMSWLEERLEPVGRVTKAGYDRLISYYNELVAKAQLEERTLDWDPPDNWQSPPMPRNGRRTWTAGRTF